MEPEAQAGTEEEGPKRVSLVAVRRLLGLAWPHRWLLSAAGLLMLLSTAISLSLPLVARQALDQVLRTHRVASLDLLAAALMALIVVGAIIGYCEYLMVAYAGNRVVIDMRRRLFAQLQRLPVAFFDRTRSGDLASRLSNDVSLLQQTLTDNLIRIVSNVATLVGGIALAVVIDWRLTVVVVVMLGATLSLFVVFGKRIRKLSRDQLDALSDAMGAMTEALANVRLVKAFGREPHEDERAGVRLERVFRLSMKSSVFEGAIGTVAAVGFFGVLIGVVWYGGRQVLLGHISGGSLLAFLMTVMIISGPMSSLASMYAQLQRAIGAADRLFGILDGAPEREDDANAVAFPDGPGRVEFDAVEFAYTPDAPVLTGLSLNAPAGKVTAIVGASGAGKTTLSLLLYRFYEPQRGAIRIDGVDVNTIRRAELRERIGIVPQEPILFNGSIRENIRYGRLDATDEEVETAARAANVAEFVEPLTLGYETVLGERGVTLSGGQRQRVAIARAVLKNPRILVLDEATSALDTRSEQLVREALERLMRGRTTLVIAHRHTTIRNADQIAVVAEGRIAEIGAHDDLLQLAGRYAALHGIVNGDHVTTIELEAIR